MATAVEPRTRTPEPGTWMIMPEVDWDTYEGMPALLARRRSLRFMYDGEDLEFMSPSPEHGEWAEIVPFVVLHPGRAFHLPCRALGASTWRNKNANRGLEADASFSLAGCARGRGNALEDLSEWVSADEARVRGVLAPRVRAHANDR